MSSKEFRVAPGGMFHVRKPTYSPETQAFLKELINESKLSMFQRKTIQGSINRGEPLPLPPNKTGRKREKKNPEPKEENIKLLDITRRRPRHVIYESGAYEQDPFVPNYSIPNHDVEKRRLQDLMAFGKTIKQDKAKVMAKINAKKKVRDDIDILLDKDKYFTETLKDIKERLDFLKFMEDQGEKKTYEPIIKREIASKLRILEDMDEGFKKELRQEYKEIQEKAASKVFGNN